MDFMWWQALLLGLWAAIAIIGGLLGNYTATVIVYAFGTGIILGDIPAGLVMGAAGQAVWLGFGIGQGGTRPPDAMAPGIFGTATFIALRREQLADLGLEPSQLLPSITEAGTFVALSIPVGIMLQLIGTAIFTIAAPLSSMSKIALEEGKFNKFRFLANGTIIITFIWGFIFGTVVGFSASALGEAADSLPWWLNNGFRVVGGLLPALGFALILKVMLKKEHLGFIFIGYFLLLVFDAIAKVTGATFSILGLTVVALGIALIIIYIPKLSGIKSLIKKNNTNKTSNVERGDDDGI